MFEFIYLPKRIVLLVAFGFLGVGIIGVLCLFGFAIVLNPNSPATPAFKVVALSTVISLACSLLSMSAGALIENELRRKNGHSNFLGMNKFRPWSDSGYFGGQLVNSAYFAIGAWLLYKMVALI